MRKVERAFGCKERTSQDQAAHGCLGAPLVNRSIL
jgi:hypothetical protein